MNKFYKISQPVDHFNKFLEQDCRPDGRQFIDFREVVVNAGSISTADGSAFVKIGETSVMCAIKAELATPREEEPTAGYIVPNVELSPMCSPMFKSGAPGELAQTSSHFLHELLISSQCVSLDDLCLSSGKDDNKLPLASGRVSSMSCIQKLPEKLTACWVLYCDLLCLNFDGNLLDVCCLALVSALYNLRLPKATYNEETGRVDVDDSEKFSLTLKCLPVASSYTVFKISDSSHANIVLSDPSAEEESVTSGLTTVVTLDSNNELCMVHKPGGAGLTEKQLTNCIKHAHGRTAKIQDLIIKTCNKNK